MKLRGILIIATAFAILMTAIQVIDMKLMDPPSLLFLWGCVLFGALVERGLHDR